MLYLEQDKPRHIPWNKGKITGQKPRSNSMRFGLSVFDYNLRIKT